MKAIDKRLAALEVGAKASGKRHLISKWESWDDDLVVDHYGRDRIGPNDEICFVLFSDSHLPEPMPYPAGYFDPGGRWAALCAERGISHRDHVQPNTKGEGGATL